MPPSFERLRKSRSAKTAILLLLALLTYGRLTERIVGPLGYDSLQSEAADHLAYVRKRALAVFLAARASTGLISVIESMQVGPVVVEGRPGMLLEPVREVVDQLGEMMTVSVVTLEALELLREIGIRMSFMVFIPLGLVVLAIGLWLRPGRFDVSLLGRGLLVAGFMLAVGVPLTIWAEEGIASSLLDAQYNTAYQNVSQMQSGLSDHLSAAETSDAAPSPDPTQPAEQPSIFSRAGNWIAGAFGSIREMALAAHTAIHQGGMEEISRWLNDKIESMLKLMTIFLVQVFLLPSLLGYAVYFIFRSVIARIVTAPEQLIHRSN